jgi:CheY-like chemotaxis protein
MPNLNGDLAIKQIRELEIMDDIRRPAVIIANSGDSDKELLHKFLMSGMEDYYIKGSNNNELIKTLAFWLSVHDDKTKI